MMKFLNAETREDIKYSLRLISRNFMDISGYKNDSKILYQKVNNTIKLWVVRILGTFAKLRKVTIDFITSVNPPDRMEKLGSHWTSFHDI